MYTAASASTPNYPEQSCVISEGGDGEEWQRHNNKSSEYLFMMETIL
jgi:hypothetical protein